jgi:hypothetical protein
VNENDPRPPFGRFIIAGLCIALIAINACGGSNENTDNNIDPEAQKIALQNEPMVKTACSGCHAFVPADKLDKTTWEAVIKVMAPKMGIFEHNGETYFNEKSDPNVDASIYPLNPTNGWSLASVLCNPPTQKLAASTISRPNPKAAAWWPAKWPGL